jgi:uncharacterized protein YjbJ (UPF0337 family)
MAMGDDDKIEGKVHELKGRLKTAAGELMNDQHLKNEGAKDKLKGKLHDLKGSIKAALDPDKR